MEDSTQAPSSVVEEPLYARLDPARMRLFRDGSGRLRLTIDGDRSFLEVKVVRTFPLSDPDHYLGLLDGKDHVIGLVVEPTEFDEPTRRTIEEELRRRYFIPTITRVHEAREEFGSVYCDVETDHGRRQFVAQALRDTQEKLGDGRLLLADVDGNRYIINDWQSLDSRSRRLLERLV
jgi:hypothetical protein